MSKLSEICEIKSGGTPSRAKKEYWNGNIPWVKISDLRSKYVDSTSEFITEDGLDNSSAKIIKKGSILFTIFATLGEVAILNIDATTNQAIAALTLNDSSVDVDYLYYFLTSLKDYVNEIGRGVAQNNINMAILRNIEVPLPSIEEQRKIAATLDKVTHTIDLCNAILEKLDLLVKSRFVEMFGNPIDNPMDWEKIAIGERCDIVTGNTPSRADKSNYGSFIEWIKSDNINTPDTFLTSAEEYLSEKGANIGRIVEAGSILMTCIAGSLKCIGNVGVADRKVAFNQQINAIVPKNDETMYIYWLMILSKPYIQSTINMALKGILSKGQLSVMMFPFPPLDLQQQFAAFVEQTDKSKLAVKKMLEKAELLKKALMQEYFG